VQLSYNGEVYNFRELRDELVAAGHAFHTNCDTEVVLHAYTEWGTDCFARFNGMWALAILDLRATARDSGEAGDARLVLARDHYGIKPLYWAHSAAGRVVFASEAKAVLADPQLEVEPDRQWLYDYLLHGLHDHKPQSAFGGIVATRGHLGGGRRTASRETFGRQRSPRRRQRSRGVPGPFRASVERRLVADVPAGTCLSGGIDSSSIVGMASQLLTRHVPDAASLGDHLKTFSIVYDGDPIDERAYMEAVLAEVDAEPFFAEPTSERFVEELDRMVWHQDEPIVSTGPYAQWSVMRLAQPEVTVLLNGQGGDELLAGYVPYQYVYLRELLRRRKLRAFAREAWETRDVLKPLEGRPDRHSALPTGLLRPSSTASSRRSSGGRRTISKRLGRPARRSRPCCCAETATRCLSIVPPAVPRPGAGRWRCGCLRRPSSTRDGAARSARGSAC
jgi:asparagine synthase (glutamine-hydrolysing)